MIMKYYKPLLRVFVGDNFPGVYVQYAMFLYIGCKAG